MCHPAALVAAAVALPIAGGFAAGSAAKAAGEIGAREAEFSGSVSDQNARYAEISAAEEMSVAHSEAAEVDTAAANIKAQQRAHAGSSGFTIGKGFVTLQEDVDRHAQKAKTRIYREGSRREHEAMIDAWESRMEAKGARFAARNSRATGRINRRVAIFGGFTSAATNAAGQA